MLIYWAKNMNTMKKNTTLVISQEVPLDVNAKRTKYMFLSCQQNTGQNHKSR
jgi:hypothetical protein